MDALRTYILELLNNHPNVIPIIGAFIGVVGIIIGCLLTSRLQAKRYKKIIKNEEEADRKKYATKICLEIKNYKFNEGLMDFNNFLCFYQLVKQLHDNVEYNSCFSIADYEILDVFQKMINRVFEVDGETFICCPKCKSRQKGIITRCTCCHYDGKDVSFKFAYYVRDFYNAIYDDYMEKNETKLR
jgi:hypothetical protein